MLLPQAVISDEEDSSIYDFSNKINYIRLNPFFEPVFDIDAPFQLCGPRLSFSVNDLESANVSRASYAIFRGGVPPDRMEYEEYVVELSHEDVLGKGGTSPRGAWFSFKISNVDRRKIYRFHLSAMSGIEEGHRPVFINLSGENSSWQRIGFDFEYVPDTHSQSLVGQHPNLKNTKSVQRKYTLSFSIRFPRDTKHSDTIVLASNQPYSSGDLEKSIRILDTSPHVQLSSLWEGDQSKKFPLIKITEDSNEVKCIVEKTMDKNKLGKGAVNITKATNTFNDTLGDKIETKEVLKPVILIIARSGASDVMSSFAVEGCMYSLAFGQSKAIRELREKFVFYVLPMVNVEGVKLGHVIKDAHFVNLRKCYKCPRKATQPQIYYLKKLLRRLSKVRRLLCFIELMGNGVVMKSSSSTGFPVPRLSMYMQGVEEAAGDAAYKKKVKMWENAAKNHRHPAFSLPTPSQYDLIFHFMNREGKYFNHSGCSFVSKEAASSSKVADGRLAASSLVHHPLCMNLVLCSVARSTSTRRKAKETKEGRGRGGNGDGDDDDAEEKKKEEEDEEGRQVMCLSARKWFLVGRNLMLALHNSYSDNDNNGEEGKKEEEVEPEGCIPHVLMAPGPLESTPSMSFLYNRIHLVTAKALTHGTSALVRRHRSAVIRQAFETHSSRMTSKINKETIEEEEGSSGDDGYREVSSDNDLYTSDEGSGGSSASSVLSTESECEIGKEKVKGKEMKKEKGKPTMIRRRSTANDGDTKRGSAQRRGSSASEVPAIVGKAPEVETIVKDKSIPRRFTAFGKKGLARKREEEDYVLTDAAFTKTVARYLFKRGKVSERARKVKLPNFSDLIARDELRWLTTHYPKKIGKSAKLDKQLEDLLSREKRRNQGVTELPLTKSSLAGNVHSYPGLTSHSVSNYRHRSDCPLNELARSLDDESDYKRNRHGIDAMGVLPVPPERSASLDLVMSLQYAVDTGSNNPAPQGIAPSISSMTSPRLRTVTHRLSEDWVVPKSIVKDVKMRQKMAPHSIHVKRREPKEQSRFI